MKIVKKIRDNVKKSLKEAELIEDGDLREKVYDAWAMVLEENGYEKIEEMEHSGTPGVFVNDNGSQADHLRGVARLAVAMTKELRDMFPAMRVNLDEVVAGALCHDIGKPFEYSPKNRKRWEGNPQASGFPAVRHSVYGVHVALTAGLPESIAHVAGAHSREGQFVRRSLVAEIVHWADESYWNILANAGIVK